MKNKNKSYIKVTYQIGVDVLAFPIYVTHVIGAKKGKKNISKYIKK